MPCRSHWVFKVWWHRYGNINEDIGNKMKKQYRKNERCLPTKLAKSGLLSISYHQLGTRLLLRYNSVYLIYV